MESIKEAFDRNCVASHGPNVDGFEKDLEGFVNNRKGAEPLNKQACSVGKDSGDASEVDCMWCSAG